MSVETKPAVRVAFFTACSERIWERLSALAETHPGIRLEDQDQDAAFVLGPTMPDPSESRALAVMVHLHKDTQRLHWNLSAFEAPETEVPETLRSATEALGGRAGLVALVSDSWESPPVCVHHVGFRLPESAWVCRLGIPEDVDDSVDSAVRQLGRTVRREQLGYRFVTGGANGIEEVTIVFIHDSSEFSIKVQARAQLRLGEGTLPYCDEVSSVVTAALFESRKPG